MSRVLLRLLVAVAVVTPAGLAAMAVISGYMLGGALGLVVGIVLGVLLLSKPVWRFLLSPLQRFGFVDTVLGVCRLCEYTPVLNDTAVENDVLREQALRDLAGGRR